MTSKGIDKHVTVSGRHTKSLEKKMCSIFILIEKHSLSNQNKTINLNESRGERRRKLTNHAKGVRKSYRYNWTHLLKMAHNKRHVAVSEVIIYNFFYILYIFYYNSTYT